MGKVSDQSLYPRLTSLQDGTALYAVLDAAGNPSSRTVDLSVVRSNLGLPGYLTPPVSSEFTFVNQGSASITTTYGISLRTPAGAAHSLRVLDKAAPTPPYTITASMLVAVPRSSSANGATFGIGWRNAGAGTLAVISLWWDSSVTFAQMRSVKFNSPTAANSAYATGDPPFHSALGGRVYFQMSDDAVNRILRYSPDGINFVQLHSVARTDFLTPDRILWYLGGGNNDVQSLITLDHWRQG